MGALLCPATKQVDEFALVEWDKVDVHTEGVGFIVQYGVEDVERRRGEVDVKTV